MHQAPRRHRTHAPFQAWRAWPPVTRRGRRVSGVLQAGLGTGSSGGKQDPKSRRLVQTSGRLAPKLASTGHQRVKERGHFPPSPQLYRQALSRARGAVHRAGGRRPAQGSRDRARAVVRRGAAGPYIITSGAPHVELDFTICPSDAVMSTSSTAFSASAIAGEVAVVRVGEREGVPARERKLLRLLGG